MIRKNIKLILLILTSSIFSFSYIFAEKDKPEENNKNSEKVKNYIYEIDSAHSSVIFKVKHMNLSNAWGRFNEFSGDIKTTSKTDPTKASVNIKIKTSSIDTANKSRDEHLTSPDFFDVKKYSSIHFSSKKIEKTDKNNIYKITGDLNFNGVSKEVTSEFNFFGIGKNLMDNKELLGCEAILKIKRSQFNMTYGLPDSVGDEVNIIISIEAKIK